MARKPSIVLDDIWSSLDRKTAGEIIANLFGENGLLERCHSTVIMATHSGMSFGHNVVTTGAEF